LGVAESDAIAPVAGADHVEDVLLRHRGVGAGGAKGGLRRGADVGAGHDQGAPDQPAGFVDHHRLGLGRADVDTRRPAHPRNLRAAMPSKKASVRFLSWASETTRWSIMSESIKRLGT